MDGRSFAKCPSCQAEIDDHDGFCPACGSPTGHRSIESDAIEKLKAALANRYRFDRQVGAGGMATVYLAHDLKHDRAVAVKVLRPELFAVLGAERFLAEIKAVARLSHPHILPLHDSGAVEGVLYYIMPFVEGETLRDRLVREPQLPIHDAVRITKEIASALDYAHRHDLVHRDVKPENILVHEGSATLTDFGIALAVTVAGGSRLTETGVSIGTSSYMSPEQATGDRHIDRRTDVYSLACVLYEMLAGELPYTGPTPQSVLAKIITGPTPSVRILRSTVSEPVAACIAKGLAKAPADRFETTAAFAEALAAAASQTITAPTPTEPAVPSRKRRLAPVAAMVVGGLALVGGLGWGLWRLTRPEGAGGPPLNRVAVLPFAYHGAEDLKYLGPGIATLVGDVLDGVAGLRIVDPAALLGTIEQKYSGSLTPDQTREVAAQFGAGRYVVGTVVSGAQGRVTVSLTAYDVRLHPQELARATADGDAMTELTRIVNDLVVATLGAYGIQESPRRLESISTPSIVALNEYLKGETILRTGDYPAAIAAFHRAVIADSLFALAWYRQAYAKSFTPDAAEWQPLADRAISLEDRLSERDRRLARAFSALLRVDVSQSAALYRKLVDDYPEDVEARFGLSDVTIHFGPMLGLPMDSVQAGFEWVLLFQPFNTEALYHLPWAAALTGHRREAAEAASRLFDHDREGFFAPIGEIVAAFMRGDERELTRAIDNAQELDDIRRWVIVNIAGAAGDLPATASLATRLLLDPGRPADVRAFGHIVLAHLELGMGRWHAAQAHLAKAAALDPTSALEARALLSLTPILATPTATLEGLRTELLAATADERPLGETMLWLAPHSGLHRLLRLQLLGLLSATIGDQAMARQYADELWGFDSPGLEGVLARAISRNVRAHLALAAGTPALAIPLFHGGNFVGDSAGNLAGIGLVERSYGSALFSQSYDRFARAGALEALGRGDAALRWYESVSMSNTLDLVHLAPSHLERAAIYERLGERAKAVEHLSRFLDLWEDADSALQGVVEEAKGRLRRLGKDVAANSSSRPPLSGDGGQPITLRVEASHVAGARRARRG